MGATNIRARAALSCLLSPAFNALRKRCKYKQRAFKGSCEPGGCCTRNRVECEVGERAYLSEVGSSFEKRSKLGILAACGVGNGTGAVSRLRYTLEQRKLQRQWHATPWKAIAAAYLQQQAFIMCRIKGTIYKIGWWGHGRMQCGSASERPYILLGRCELPANVCATKPLECKREGRENAVKY